MFQSFVTMFFGSGYQPNDFELVFALVFFMMFFHAFSSIICGIRNMWR